MAIYNLGSINIDRVYRVPHIPAPGETLASLSYAAGLGGKGANLSIAAARAGGEVRHLGAVGEGADWALQLLADEGVDLSGVARLEGPTGHAIINVDDRGENAIVLLPGANRALEAEAMLEALRGGSAGDWFVTQNETNLQAEAAQAARGQGMKVAYCAAPFEVAAVEAARPFTDLLLLNTVEAAQLAAATGLAPGSLGIADVVVTRGGEGADWFGAFGHRHLPAPRVEPVDTTGAGDCLAGYLIAGLSRGMAMEAALERAIRAAAIKVTRHGAATGIPSGEEVDAARS